MLNHFIVMGRLTAEPEVRYTEKDKIPLCRFSIACTRPKRKDSEQETDFFNCVAWRNAAEIVSNYYSKSVEAAKSSESGNALCRTKNKLGEEYKGDIS